MINNDSISEREFVIVKNANDQKWQQCFLEDPRITGVKRQFSAYFTFYGVNAKVELSYRDFNKAYIDMKRLLDLHPNGDYDICPVG